jgi:peptidoglycan/xylan/chitin deacetylase (PgdA/CDA1 family)
MANKFIKLLHYTGVNYIVYKLRTTFERKTFYIVAYHNITKSRSEKFLYDTNNVSCDEKAFEEQLKFYKKHYTVIPYSSINDKIHKISPDKPALIITFDDGYRSVYTIAAPLLEKYQLPATVFLSTSYIGSHKMFWWEEVMYYANKLGYRRFFDEAFSVYFIPDSNLDYVLNSCEYTSFSKILLSYLKRQNHGEVVGFLSFIRYKFRDICELAYKEKKPVEIMTWEQVRELTSKRFEFGSHTVNHYQVTMCDEETLLYEIDNSKKVIEFETGKPVYTFCYPSGTRGSLNTNVSKILKETNYKYACLMEYGYNKLTQNTYEHRRVAIDPSMDILLLSNMLRNPIYFRALKKYKTFFGNARDLLHKIKLMTKLTPHVVSRTTRRNNSQIHVFFTICDHYEPYWNMATHRTAYNRVKVWIDNLPKILGRYKDSDGRCPKYSFFYPVEEYRKELLNIISSLCKERYGEVEIHLHHDNDNSENLRYTLIDFKDRLYSEHGLLSKDKAKGEVCYGFVHGNWALDNSNPDGRWCGVNDELTILKESGCYGDFTMPSAPHITQTQKINSIYYAMDDQLRPKSHDTGENSSVGNVNSDSLLMIQGPLSLRWDKGHIRIENGEITADNLTSLERVAAWINCGISVKGKPDWIFIKLHTHGMQENNTRVFIEENGLDGLFSSLESKCATDKYSLHYVSPREMVNVVHAIENGANDWNTSLLDYKYELAN